MTVRTFALAAFASAALIGSAAAEDRINVTPTLYREQARVTATVRPASELTTTPRLVPTAPANSRIIAEVVAR